MVVRIHSRPCPACELENWAMQAIGDPVRAAPSRPPFGLPLVKTTFFNGVEHPAIGILRANGDFELVREFSYEDFKGRLS